MRKAAQDAGVGRFEHILLCTDSMAEATVQTLPVRNCVVCSLSGLMFQRGLVSKEMTQHKVAMSLREIADELDREVELRTNLLHDV